MITCKNCNAFASAISIKFNKWTDEIGKLTIKPCKRCGSDEGDYEDFEEIDYMFGLQEYETLTPPNNPLNEKDIK